MKRLQYVGSNSFVTGNQSDFEVYYYIHKNDATETYGIRLEKKYNNSKTEYEYEEEKGITKSLMLAEELADFLIDYKVTPISLCESLDIFLNRKE